MDPSSQPSTFRESIRNNRARTQASVMAAAATLLVGLGLVANLLDAGSGETMSPRPPQGTPVAVVTATATSTPSPTPAPTLSPTPAPTPVPVLAARVAVATTAELAPTGVLVADTGDPTLTGLVADTNGSVWTSRAGALLNVDPRTGRTRAWTLADDPAFATEHLAPSQQGGVWLVAEDAIRLFDGERFRAIIETPEPLWFVAEDRTGSLWAQTETYGLVRWADGVWASAPPGRPGSGVGSLVVDAEGQVWTADLDVTDGVESSRGISVWDGSAWTTFAPGDLPEPVFGGSMPELFAAGDGTVWAARGRFLVRFSSGEPTGYDVVGLHGSVSLRAAGDDGRLWFVRGECEGCDVQVQVYDGSTLTTYDAEDGLPGAEDAGGPAATVLSGPGYVLAATDTGLYRLEHGSWQRLETSTRPGSAGRSFGLRDGFASLAAISRTEVWATTRSWRSGNKGDGLYHLAGATWHRRRLPDETAAGQAVVAPDGTLWVATSSGPLVRRDGTWIDLGDQVAGAVPEPGEVDPRCGGAVLVVGNGTAYYAGPRTGNRVVALRKARGGWKASLASAPASGLCPEALAASADGSIWLLQRGWGNALSRSTGGPWEPVSPPSDAPDTFVNPTAIVADRDGSLWMAVDTWDSISGASQAFLMQLVDGHWVRHGDGGGPGYASALALLPDGLLIAVGDGISRFDGQQWHQSWRGLWFNAVSVAPDGAVWVAGPNVYRLPPSLP